MLQSVSRSLYRSITIVLKACVFAADHRSLVRREVLIIGYGSQRQPLLRIKEFLILFIQRSFLRRPTLPLLSRLRLRFAPLLLLSALAVCLQDGLHLSPSAEQIELVRIFAVAWSRCRCALFLTLLEWQLFLRRRIRHDHASAGAAFGSFSAMRQGWH